MTATYADPAVPSLRRVASLAFPALVVLAAEPLYVLVDPAVVGHLGRTPLASLAIGGGVLSVAAWLGVVLAYGTTGRAARRYGAGDRAAAVAEGVQASWLALAAGVLIAVGAQLAAGPLARTLAGHDAAVAAGAAQWLRIAALGAPGLMLGTAGNGWLRGVQDTRRPLIYVLGANALSAALCPLLVYPLGLGLVGSAIANAAAQSLAGVLFIWALVAERVPLRPLPTVIRRQLGVGRDLLLRGAAFQACFLSAAAVAARFGAGRAGQARWLARRISLIGLVSGIGFAVVIGAGAPFLPRLFSSDPGVYAQAMLAWPWFAGMQPLDGVLIGAGDVRYMRNLTLVAALGGFLPAIWTAYLLRLGLAGVWAGLTLFVAIRLVALLVRMHSGRWAVVGVTH